MFGQGLPQDPDLLVEPRLALDALRDGLEESFLLLPGAFEPGPLLLLVNLFLDLLAQLE